MPEAEIFVRSCVRAFVPTTRLNPLCDRSNLSSVLRTD
jgi:hypothetical protein